MALVEFVDLVGFVGPVGFLGLMGLHNSEKIPKAVPLSVSASLQLSNPQLTDETVKLTIWLEMRILCSFKWQPSQSELYARSVALSGGKSASVYPYSPTAWRQSEFWTEMQIQYFSFLPISEPELGQTKWEGFQGYFLGQQTVAPPWEQNMLNLQMCRGLFQNESNSEAMAQVGC